MTNMNRSLGLNFNKKKSKSKNNTVSEIWQNLTANNSKDWRT